MPHRARPAVALAVGVLVALSLVSISREARISQTPSRAPSVPRPNIILINLDDTRADGIDHMPNLLSQIAARGTRFSNSFVTNSVCAPSRASLLSGRYSLHNGTRSIGGPLGGAHTFRENGADRETVAVWLRAAGYRTGLFGKYINGYSRSEQNKGPGGTFYVPPGWDRWLAFVSPERYGGVHGGTYTLVDEQRVRTVHDDHSGDAQYSTDVLGAALRDFVAGAAAAGVPFFAVWTPNASHVDGILYPAPADRHVKALGDLAAWRPPSWNESDVRDKPRWVQFGRQNLVTGAVTDIVRQRAYQSLLAVDEQLGRLTDLLAQLGIERDTVILVTSDNGVGWGEHRMWSQRKECPYEECLRVPLLIRDLRAFSGSPVVRDTTVLNIDVPVTIAALAGVAAPSGVDGISFADAQADQASGRRDFLIEHWRDPRDDDVVYRGQVTDGDQLRLLHGDPRAQPRASTLFEFDSGDGVAAGAVAVAIGADADATFVALRKQIVAHVPHATSVLNTRDHRLAVRDRSAASHGVYWWLERDQGGVLQPLYDVPDYLGVRDVANGYTYVEYETGEVELYNLTDDPAQLDNKADDPGYRTVRAQYAARLRALAGEAR